MYLVVNTFLDYSDKGENQMPAPMAGTIWGPFDSREEVRTWIEGMNFPRPEHVYIRPLRNKDY